MWGISKDICLPTMRLKIQMASFDSGHTADMAYLPHVGSSNKHFPRQSDWYILSMHFFYIGKMMWVQGYEFQTVNEFPSYWSICVAGVAGAIRRPCQLWLFVSLIRADIELSYCSSLHFLLMNGSTLHRSSTTTKTCLRRRLTNPVNQHRSTHIIYHLCALSFLHANIWDVPAFFCRKCPKGCL